MKLFWLVKMTEGWQMVLWILVPSMIPKGSQTPKIMTYLLITSVFQYIPKVFHTVSASRRMQLVTGFVFGTAWWGFVMNLTYYYIAAHVSPANLLIFSCLTCTSRRQCFPFRVGAAAIYLVPKFYGNTTKT